MGGVKKSETDTGQSQKGVHEGSEAQQNMESTPDAPMRMFVISNMTRVFGSDGFMGAFWKSRFEHSNFAPVWLGHGQWG